MEKQVSGKNIGEIRENSENMYFTVGSFLIFINVTLYAYRSEFAAQLHLYSTQKIQ